jgi:hypothetical protein
MKGLRSPRIASKPFTWNRLLGFLKVYNKIRAMDAQPLYRELNNYLDVKMKEIRKNADLSGSQTPRAFL